VVHRPWDPDGLASLRDVLPPLDGLRDPDGFLVLKPMLLLYMALYLGRPHPVLALAANNDSQARDLLE
jgi:hypothetical protein